jgi:hypothetical protein
MYTLSERVASHAVGATGQNGSKKQQVVCSTFRLFLPKNALICIYFCERVLFSSKWV